MSNVTLTIGGRNYTVASAAGEEAHVVQLGALIDAKLAGMAGLGNQSEARTLLYAALLLADELHEARRASSSTTAAPEPDAHAAEALESLAEQLESLAKRLENGDASA